MSANTATPTREDIVRQVARVAADTRRMLADIEAFNATAADGQRIALDPGRHLVGTVSVLERFIANYGGSKP